jgi:uncharacterized membrane protein YdjX (TVP38/TMEM64 family)
VQLTIAGFELDRRKIVTLVLIVLGCVGLALLYKQIDVPALHRRAEQIDGVWIFVLMTLLPLAGFPVTVGHAIAGVRFGLPLGLALVSLSIVLQMLLSYALVKAAPKLFARHFEPLRKRLPHAAHTPLTQFTMLLPGVPYFAQNYVLPLAGLPLGTYLLWGVPIHILRSIVGIAFGDMSDDLTPARIAGFVAYFVVITVTCTWSFRRLQARMKDRPPAADGRKPRASKRSAARRPARR